MLPPILRVQNFRRISTGSAARAALCLTIASLLTARSDALTINPIWDSSITSDPNAAQIESIINGVLANYQTAFAGTNITLDVNILEDSSIGGANNSPNTFSTTYSLYRSALQSHGTTLDDVAVVAGLTPANPLNSSSSVVLSRANAAALGFTVTTNGDGSVTTGTVRLGLTSGAAVNTAFIQQAFAHEFDEELGTISGVGGSTPWAIDFTRYSAAGQRALTTDPTTHAYFSVDGVNLLAEYNQFNHQPGDYGDFALGSVHHVQDYAISGDTVPAVELRMLDSVGYGFTGRSVSNAFATNTLNTVTLSTLTTAGGVIPNVPSNDVQITEGGGSGTVTLAAATTVVNTLINTATATAVTVNLAGQHLVAGNGAVDAGAGLIEIGSGATSLIIGAAANDGTVTAGSSGAYTLGLISLNPSSALDIRSAIVDNAGGGAVSVMTLNTGVVILEGTNTYSGATTVGSGSTLQIGNGGATGSLGGGAVEVDGTLKFNRSNTAIVANSFTGAGSIVQSGSGTIVITGSNTGYTGTVTINLGSTLQIGSGAVAGDLASAVIADAGSLVFNRSDNFTVANTISGSGSLTQAGTGKLILTSTPGYTGGTIVQLGTLQIAPTATLGTGNYLVEAGCLLEVSSNASQSFSGVISGEGGLTKDTSSSTLTLSAANTYSGATTVNSGTLALNFSAAGAPLQSIVSSNSSLVLRDGKVLITGAPGKFNAQAFSGTAISGAQGNFTLSQNGAASLDVNLGPITFNAGAAASFNGATGTTIGARFLTSTGSASAMLGSGSFYNGTDWAAKDASNTYIVAYAGYTDIFTGTTGSKSVTVPNSAGADVRIVENGATGAPNTLGAPSTAINSLLMSAATTASTISMANGTLTVNAGAGVVGGVAVAAGAKSLTIGSSANDGFVTAGASGASTLLFISNNSAAAQSLIVNSRIKDNAGGGAVALSVSGGTGAGTVTLNGTNTFSGGIDITNSGTVQIGGAGSLGAGNYAGAILNSGLLDYSSSATQTLSGAISGPGGLTKDTSASTLTLTGANTFTGNITLSTGALRISGAGVLGGGNYSGSISGAGAFVYNSSATQTLSGSNTSFNGNVTISAGVLAAGNSNSLGAANTAVTKVTVTSGGTLDLAGFTNMNYGVTISGTGSSGQGALTNSVQITSPGSAQTPNITLAANATIGGSGDLYEVATSFGANTLNLASFTLTKAGTDTFWLSNTTVTSGTIDVSGGVLSQTRSSNAAAAAIILDNTAGVSLSLNGLAFSAGSLSGGGAAGGNVALGSGTLIVGALHVSTTYAGVISGSGSVTIAGSINLTGANTYTGTTAISGGTLSFASGSLSSSNNILMSGGTLQWDTGNTNDVSSTALSLVSGTAATFDTNGNTVTLGSAMIGSATGSVVKAGSGTLILAATETYTGPTTINAGTLQLGSSSAAGGLGGGAVTVNTGATLAFGGNSAVTLSDVISGAGNLSQTGTGTTTLSSANPFAGPVAVNAGVLLVSGSLGDATVAIGSGGAFGGAGTVGSAATNNASLTFQAGSMLEYAGNPLTLNGNISISGATSIIFSTSPVSGTQYAIVDYSGTLTGSANLTSVYRGTIDTATPGVLKFDAGAIGLTWRGSTNANWGIVDGNKNFVQTASLTTADNFFQGDTVAFDDSSSVKTITLNGALMPAAVTVNTTGTYTFSGTGSLAGSATLSKSGAGTLIVNTANTYTGVTSVNAGTLRLGNASALGATSGVAISSGATLDLNALTVANLTFSGAGSLGNSSTTTKAYVTNVTLAGDATVSDTSAQKAILFGSITGQNGSVNLGGFTLTKSGTGSLILNGVNMTGAGNIIVNGGTLQIVDDYPTGGLTQEPTTIAGTGTITVNSGASLMTTRWTVALNMTMPIALNGGTLGSTFPGPNGATIASPISLTASSSLNFNGAGNPANVTLSGIISGGNLANLTVTGDTTGVRTLTGVNTYAGNTTLSAGTLTIGGSGSLGAGTYAGAISLASGTSFKYSSTATQTLSGVISGAGALTESGSGALTLSNTDTYNGATTVSGGTLLVNGSISGSVATVNTGAAIGGTGALGSVTIQSGGTIQPGTASGSGLLGTGNFSLTSGGHLSLEIGGVTGTGTSSTQYSELNVTGTVSLAGDVQISLFNGYTPVVGNTFYIILNDGSDAITGAFSNAPGGMITSGGVQYQVAYQANGNGGTNDVSLTVFAVPEPNAGFLALSGLALAAGLLRLPRRRR